MNVATGGIQPEHYKTEAFSNLDKPNKWGDLHMIIGIFVFYSQLLPLYEVDTRPWNNILSKHTQPGKLSEK